MVSLETWEQTALFNPADPTQKKIEMYAGIPGQYASYYFNKVPTTSTLKGVFSDGLETGAGIGVGLVIASLLVGAGTWVAHRAGFVKFKKPHGVAGLGGLLGKRYRRRKRR